MKQKRFARRFIIRNEIAAVSKFFDNGYRNAGQKTGKTGVKTLQTVTNSSSF